ncbi:hypothetical protein QR680_007352 [Steinernema hermaphroditum]|uniref:FANCI helical domain-containing protein n=1 Tax=Steinernema hermaphroditum TaxID=289476 RepID=A0AA39IEI6_9BILA|nr:hypothetical protein QR680_007352 [Steinernema hermaphroditum]
MEPPSSSRFFASQIPSICSQGSTSQLSQKSVSHIKKFVRDFLERGKSFRHVMESSDAELLAKLDRYREPLRNVFQNALAKESTRMKVFNYLIKSCSEDCGQELTEVADYWLLMIDAFGLRLESDMEEQYRFDIFSVLLETLRVVDTLSLETVLKISALITQKMNKRAAAKVCNHFEQFFIDERRVNKRFNDGFFLVLQFVDGCSSFSFSDPTSTLPGSEAVNCFLIDLLEKATTRNIDNIVQLVKSCKRKQFFSGFIKSCLDNVDVDDNELFLRILPALPEADKPLLTNVMQHFCNRWTGLSEAQMGNLIEVMLALQKSFSDNVAFRKSMIAFLKNNNRWMFASNFGFLVGLLLAAISCQHEAAFSGLTSFLTRLFRYENKLKSHLWISKTVNDSLLDVVRGHLELLFVVMQQESLWVDIFCPVLEEIGYSIIVDGAKSMEVVFSSGRLEDTGGLAFFGRWILVQTHNVDVRNFASRLKKLITAVSSAASSSAEAKLLFIDIFIELLMTQHDGVFNAYRTIQTAVENICLMSDARIAVTMIRAAMPVIVQRHELRESLFKTMKTSMINSLKVDSALPIMLLLLKAVSPKETIHSQFTQAVDAHVPSQSFATFSSQFLRNVGISQSHNERLAIEIVGCLRRCFSQPATTKCILFKGLVDAAVKSSTNIVPSLDLVLEYADMLPPLELENYVETAGSMLICKHPVAHVIQTISSLMRLSICKRRNESGEACGLTNLGDEITLRAERFLTKILDEVVEKDEADLALDKLSDFSNSAKGKANTCFANLMMQLYDALIEHLWYIGDVACNLSAADKLIKVVERKEKIEEVLLEKRHEGKKREDDSTIDLNTVEVAGMPSRLQHSIGVLSQMFATLVRRDVPRRFTEECLEKLRDNMMKWLLDVLVEQTASFDPSSGTHSVSINSLDSLAITSITLYNCVDLARQFEHLNVWDSFRAKAITIYSNVVTYLLRRYPSKCHKVLENIMDSVLSYFTVEAPISNQTIGQKQATILRHLALYTKILLPNLFDNREAFHTRKLDKSFRRQTTSIIRLCRLLSGLTVSSAVNPDNETLLCNRPNSLDQMLKMKIIYRLLKNAVIEDATVARDLWKLLIDLGLCSVWSDHWWSFLTQTTKECQSRLAGQENARRTKSITSISVESVLNCLADALQTMLGMVLSALDIKIQISDPVDDTFMAKIISAVSRICETTEIALQVHIDSGYCILRDAIVALLNKIFETMLAIVKQFVTQSKGRVDEVAEWKSVALLEDSSRGTLTRLMAKADEHVGVVADGEVAPEPKKTTRKKMKKQDTMHVHFVRHREQFQSSLISLAAKLKIDDLAISVRGNAIGVRDFRLDGRKLAEKLVNVDKEDLNETRRETPKRKKRRTVVNEETEVENVE